MTDPNEKCSLTEGFALEVEWDNLQMSKMCEAIAGVRPVDPSIKHTVYQTADLAGLIPTSPFLRAWDRGEAVARSLLAFAIRDKYPVSPGHTLVVPFRQVETWFDATWDEQLAILELVDEVRRDLVRDLKPDGFNVGFNAGVMAGQTVMHLHVHVIPRYKGDMDDPRGGVRGVIPDRQKY